MGPPGSESSQNKALDHTTNWAISHMPQNHPLLIDLIVKNIMPQYIPLYRGMDDIRLHCDISTGKAPFG